MINVFRVTVFFIFLFSCNKKDAQDFYCNHVEVFGNSWWEFNFEGKDQCFNVYDGNNTVWLYDIEEERAWFWQEWSFTPPNTYHLDDYDIGVFPSGDCYEIKLWDGVMSDIVCECPVEPDWREPYELQSFDHSVSNSF